MMRKEKDIIHYPKWLKYLENKAAKIKLNLWWQLFSENMISIELITSLFTIFQRTLKNVGTF